MAEPKRLTTGGRYSGVRVEYVKRRRILYLSGWYDDCAGIEGQEFSLAEFFKALGIDKKACDKTFVEMEAQADEHSNGLHPGRGADGKSGGGGQEDPGAGGDDQRGCGPAPGDGSSSYQSADAADASSYRS
jgi:hypothetical protein